MSIDSKIAAIVNKQQESYAGHTTDINGDLIAWNMRIAFTPSTLLQQAMPLAEEYELTIDMGGESAVYSTQLKNNVYRAIKTLSDVPLAIC